MLKKLFSTGLDPLEVDVPHLIEAQSDADVQVVDCREPNEWVAGHLPDSTLIPLDALAFRKGELDAQKPVIIVCRSGRRSLVAAEMLTRAGFTDAKSLHGGLIGWVNAGHPLVGGQ